jgi:hypothetical protein
MEQVFTRVANWNAARYEQEYNQELTLKLLREEYREWVEAEFLPEQVQELCDVIFVAYGAMWKLGFELSSDLAQLCFREVDQLVMCEAQYPGTLVNSTIDILEIDNGPFDNNTMKHLFKIALYAQAQLLAYGLTFEQVIECMLVLCDSNDSKKIVKTASDVKANDNDKGAYYKSPVPGITAILKEANTCESVH